MAAITNTEREAARQAYLARKAYFAPLQKKFDENFKAARSEEELLAADGKVIREHLAAHRAA